MTSGATGGALPIGLAFRGPRRWRHCFDDVFGDLQGPPAQTLRLRRRRPGRLAVSLAGQRVTGTPAACASAILIEHGLHVAAAAAPTLAVLTGAAVAVDGAGVALVAPPRSGATTLARALLDTGADALADAIVLIDSGTNTVLPFPLPFPAALPALPVRASTLARLAPALPLRALVVPQRSETAVEPSVELLGAAAALALLATCTAAATAHETAFFHRLATIARTTPVHVARYHEAADIVPALRAALR